MSPAACAQALKTQFPALFDGPVKPLKLRIQADIQERAPGQFSKQLLSAFLRRYTGGTAYLIALSKATHRFDLDGQPAGELADEHREAAITELARRRSLNEERRELELQQRRNRAGLLHDFQITTLTRANFCALKGVADEELDGLLEIARQEAIEDQARRANRSEGRPEARPGQRPDQRPNQRPGDRRGPPRGERPRGPRADKA
ncbi:ProQ/FinO family protein [Paucibacter sp. M5-1]|uniref:ProQ/FinO family protein n=1 Tax=Paucibacter sp. M5-1 TaxID=3015998 RepID=UPI0022B8793F|nr:ProQ/FinO family protein [Paucibacter sp. M5-1]MCZ7880196.1 ProQ/FinO family protein [Paucibacter sp. M5-1]